MRDLPLSDFPFRLRPAREEVRQLFSEAEILRWQGSGNPEMVRALSSEEAEAVALSTAIGQAGWQWLADNGFPLDDPSGETDEYLRHHRSQPWEPQDPPLLDGRLCSLLVERAYRSAELGGHLWTPLLDAVAMDGVVWQVEPDEKEAYEVALPQARRQADHQRALEQAGEWAARQEDPRQIERLAQFRYPPLLGKLAGRARVWDPDLLQRLLEAHPSLLDAVARNPHLSCPGELLERALQALEGGTRERSAADALSSLAELHDWVPSPEEKERLLQVLEREASRPLPEPVGGEEWREEMARRRFEPWGYLLGWLLYQTSWIQPEDLPRLVPTLLYQDSAAHRFFEIAGEDLSLRHQMLPLLHSESGLAEWLVKDAVAMRCPLCRQAVLSLDRSWFARQALPYCEAGPEYREAFRSLAERDPDGLLRMLEQTEEKALRSLRAEDLAWLLQSASQEVRLRAIQWSGRLGEVQGEEVPAPPPPQTSPLRRV